MGSEFRDDLVALVPRLRRFAQALAGSRDEGDDLVQAACVKALTRAHQFEPGTRLDSWMFRIVQTLWIDRARARRRRPEGADPDDLPEPSDGWMGARLPEDRLTLSRVRAGVERLPDDQRAVIALVAIEGYSYREAADLLEIPIGTVMSRLSRARAKLEPLVREPIQ